MLRIGRWRLIKLKEITKRWSVFLCRKEGVREAEKGEGTLSCTKTGNKTRKMISVKE